MKTTLLILILGDSIAHGWAHNVPAPIPAVNCRGTRQYLERTEDGPSNLEVWMQGNRYRTIVFNAGLHDVQQQVPLAEYEANLRKIVQALRPRSERLFFCSITPGRVLAPACTPEAVGRYNAVALRVMREESVTVIDLYALASAHPEWWKSQYDIHYTEAGYKQMAEYVKHALTP